MSLSISDVKLNLWADRYKSSETRNEKTGDIKGQKQELTSNSTTLPEASSFHASVIGDTFITLTWKNVVESTGYKLTRSSDNNFKHDVSTTTIGQITTFTDNTVAPNLLYYYKLDAISANPTTKDTAALLSIKTLSPLQAPTAFTVTNVDDTNIDLTWAAIVSNDGTITYTVQQSTTSNFTSATNIYTGQLPTCVPINLNPSTQYYFRIFATNATHTFPVYAYVNTITAASLGTPSVPTATTTTSSVTLTWTNSDARPTGYVLERSLTGGNTFTTTQTLYSGPLMTFTDNGLITGTTYYYRVSATKIGFTTQISPTLTVTTS